MDSGNGLFEQYKSMEELLENYPEVRTLEPDKADHVFRVGEEIELKGSRFRVKSIKPTELRLKLLPRK